MSHRESQGKYILKGKKAVRCHDLFEWARWFESSVRTIIKTRHGDVEVSTIFLGLDHSFDGKKPLLFETMVFGGPSNGDTKRYSTWEQAESGHIEMVKKIFHLRDDVLVIWNEELI